MKKRELLYKTYIRTTPKKLWEAITDPKFTSLYWAGNSNLSDWKKGSRWQHVAGGEHPEIYVDGKVLECVPLKRLVLSWIDPENRADSSRVTFEIEPYKKVVCLTVTHGNFKTGSTVVESVSGGWPRVLSSMKSFLETGEALNVFGGN